MDDQFEDFVSSVDGPSNPRRSPSVQRIVFDVLAERAQGMAVSDADVLAKYPGLAEDLKPELRLVDQIRQARLAAERVGTPLEKLKPITDSEFDELLCDAPEGQEEAAAAHPLPRLPGYLILEEINHGGQAVVYRATQESTGRVVAVKVMSGGPFVSSRHRARFDREVRILGALDHSNIVSIIDRGRTPDGSFFCIMQYIDGLALDHFWQTQIGTDEQGTRQLVHLFATIAHAVQAAHVRRVIHRDLKPSNIRIDRRGEPHILDFGLARPLEGHDILAAATITMPGQIIGSLPWASPEQAAGRAMELDQRSDIYSIGVILFQALTGQFPYSLRGPIDQVLLRIRTANAEPPSKAAAARAGVNRLLDLIVLKALEKLPEHRYPSAGDLAQDLEAWLAGRPILTVHRRSRRHRLPRVMAGVLIMAIALGTWGWRATRPPVQATFNLPTQGNSIGMKLVRIPHGVFDMGSPDTETGRNKNESRQRVVIPDDFFMAATEVTQEQYEKIMHENPSDPKWRGPKMPVGNVSWTDADAFCRRLSEIEHAHYRLPTEAEWEYACRARTHGPFQNPENPDLTVWSLQNSGGAPKPVAVKLPNAWGLFDMQGNVAEWCEDAGDERVAALPSRGQPPPARAVRGGSALNSTTDCRAASRQFARESFQSPDRGFRVVRDP